MKNSDMPINPICNEHGYPSIARTVLDNNEPQCSGLSKREYFAGLAMQGMIGSETWALDELAECAVNAADALLNQLQATEGE